MERREQTIEAQVEQAGREWMAATFRRDLAACGRFLADEFTMVTNRGSQIDRAQWLDNTGRRVGMATPPEFRDVLVRAYGDAALVTSRSILRATFDSKDWSGEFYVTDVWVRRAGRWQVVRRHSSTVVPGAE